MDIDNLSNLSVNEKGILFYEFGKLLGKEVVGVYDNGLEIKFSVKETIFLN